MMMTAVGANFCDDGTTDNCSEKRGGACCGYLYMTVGFDQPEDYVPNLQRVCSDKDGNQHPDTYIMDAGQFFSCNKPTTYVR